MEGAARILYRRYFALNALIDPSAGGRTDAFRSRVLLQGFAQRRHDLRAAAFTFGAGEANQLSGGTERDRKLDGFVEVAADHDRDLGPIEAMFR